MLGRNTRPFSLRILQPSRAAQDSARTRDSMMFVLGLLLHPGLFLCVVVGCRLRSVISGEEVAEETPDRCCPRDGNSVSARSLFALG